MDKFIKFVDFVLTSPRSRLLKILKSNKQVIGVIAEIVLNILLKNIKVKPHVARRLRKYRRALYKLVNPAISIAKKRHILTSNVQLLHILSPLLPGISKSFKDEPLYENVSHHRRR